MYEEANTQPYVGRKAVVEVVINRAIASNKHVCDIIRERSQFSWVNKNTNVYRLTDSKKSERDVITITKEIVSGKQVLSDNTKFFYSKSLASPAWATKMDCIDIGDHTFCKQRVR
jgi:spore germination cell wall hydrolase CwlJ-like protein